MIQQSIAVQQQVKELIKSVFISLIQLVLYFGLLSAFKSNGLIVQWGIAVGDEVDVRLPVSYTQGYSISISTNAHSRRDDWSRTGTYEHK